MAESRSLIRGAAIGVVAAVLVFGLAQILNLAPAGSRLVFVEGAAAGVVFGLIARGRAGLEALGAAVVGLVALFAGLAIGWGWLEYSGLVGSGLAVIWLLTGERRPQPRWEWFRWGGVLVPVLLVVLLPLVLDGGALGHDEAAYGLKARSWLDETSETGWLPHRGIGMSGYGYLVLVAGGSEAGLRMLGLAGLLALTAGTWALGRRMASPRVAALAAIGVVAGPSMLRRSTEYLSDVPAAALLVLCMVIIWRELAGRDLPTYRLLWLLPLAWIAFYLRYQSILSLALIAVVTVILWWRKIRQRPGPALAVLLLGFLGFIPHFIQSVDLIGSPWGMLTLTARAGGRAFMGEGLVDYARQLGWSLAGFVGPIVAVAAIAGLIRSWPDADERRRGLFLLLPAVLQGIILGLVAHGEPRFVFFPLALVVVAGMISIDGWVSRRRGWTVVPVAYGLVILLAGSVAVSMSLVRPSVADRARVNLAMERSALEVRSQAGDSTCGVLTTFSPQVTYYSLCATRVFGTAEPLTMVNSLEGDARFMILIDGDPRQPPGPVVDDLVDLAAGPPVIVEAATVYRFAD